MVGSGLALSLLSLGTERQIWGIGEGSGTFTPGTGGIPTCLTNVPLHEQPPCILPPLSGGFIPPKEKRSFTLPPDYGTNAKKVIEQLELELEQLQNKRHKSAQDKDDIEAIKGALKYLAGITAISAPPGTGSTFTPGKRSFSLPPDYASNTKEAIKQLEVTLVKLQNKRNKTAEDKADIQAIKAALKYLAGITSITAPSGTGSTFTPGKRQAFGLGGSGGSYSSKCPNLDGAELALEALLHKSSPSVQEIFVIQSLKHFLYGCGITIVKSPDGTSTTIKPSDKRDVALTADFDVAGLEQAYGALLSSVSSEKPSFTTWLTLEQIADMLEIYGVSVDHLSLFDAGKRQISIGGKTCQASDVMGLKAALAALLTAYGDPAHAPPNVFLVEQIIVTALQICGQSVQGWTTLTPGNPIPGGAIIPNPTIPGGAITPDPTTPGGAITPDPYNPGSPIRPDPYNPGGPMKPSDKRQAPIKDPAALLAALHTLEDKYGRYGSGTIPVPIFLIMVNIVTILQDIPGVVVPGWPILGQGSVVFGPSS
ncbi:hypothetical protein B0T26DRAFT_741070 [Lasiosphaeria miniovina]|uniref:Uncharacterized protein n=1 Tax=Lasiosphaeria miniovina TaxID=1954250 RepID=A0AA40ALD3_9PEZI|nr:uncharacterized protein B0T26DRAFT_741070 [Lasiosphaeria miniovina]KAK0717915.1 hypothetical protein B0T26DRAFT_741070 [Lasiosphaeria miniovina]